ncbi:MAG: sigma-B regulation protein RsbU (phosphoserine phosphatase) [Chlamydiales bacterium]|jgi:sigma-B regulation protein RsbU (phosphoserine phosphatase)
MANATVSERQLRNLQALLDVSKAMGHEVHLDNLLALILDKATEVMEADRSSLFLYDPDTNELWSKIAQGMTTHEIRFPVGLGIAGDVAKTMTPSNIHDAYDDPRFNKEFDIKSNYRTKSVLCLPMIGHNSELVGVIQVLNKQSTDVFDKIDEDLLAALGAHAGVALQRALLIESFVEKEKLEETLKLANEIQMSMVPKKFPPFPHKKHLIDIHASIEPAKDVGGDLYAFELLDDDHLAFAIGDVSGKGVPAALFMAIATTFLKAIADKDLCPSDTLIKLNDFLSTDNEADMFVTFVYGILDINTGHIAYSNGGHNPIYILRTDGSFDILAKPIGTALGVIGGLQFEPATAQLNKGDVLYLYTDGVNEAMNEEFEEYTYPRMEELLRGIYKKTAKEIVEASVLSVKEFAGKAPQSDDITLLTIRIPHEGEVEPE